MGNSKAISQDFGKLLLRVTVAGLLLFHGVSKLIHGVSWMAGPLAALHLPAFIAYGVYVGEVIAPVFVILGVYARLGGLIIAFDMFMAVLLVARGRMFALNGAGGWGLELEAFYFFTALCVFFIGAGRFSLGGTNGNWN